MSARSGPCRGAAQRLAVDGDNIPLAQQRGHIGEHLAEGGVKRLGINHPKHCREGIVRRDGVLDLQKVFENALFCATEGSHLSAGRRPAEHRNECGHEKLAKNMPGVLDSWVGDVIEGGKEDVHGGDGLQTMNPPSRIHFVRCRKGRRSRRLSQMRFRWQAERSL